MDTSTAQTGLTIWGAILLASIPGILTAFLGSYLSLRNSIKIAEKRFRSDLELKREDINLIKSKALVELKINLLNELERYLKMLPDEFDSDSQAINDLSTIRDRAQSFLPDTNIAEALQIGINIISKASKKYKKISKIPGKPSKEEVSLARETASTLYASIRLSHQRLAGDLGFGKKIALDPPKEIEIAVAKMLKRLESK